MTEERIIDEVVLREYLSEKKYKELRATLSEMNAADIAAIMDDMEDENSLRIFRILPKDMAADVFSDLEIESQQYIIQSLSDKEASNIIDNMMADDATDLLEEMPANVVKKILANARPDTRADINHLLRYPEDSAGSIMTVEYMQETDIIGEIMNDNVISINTLTDQEEAANMFKKYDFTAMPVVDNENRLVGIITIDDVVDILEEEATEDIEKMAAIIPTDKPYFRVGIFETYRKRMPWLLLLMISATFTGAIITKYTNALASYVVLTAYIPMLMDTGGNAGSQASVSIIRGLSLGEVEFGDIFKTIWKEIRVAILCGLTLSLTNFVKLLVLDHLELKIAFIVCITLVLVVCFAKLVGCTLPLVAAKIGFDPAVMASPLITTIVDAISLSVYFALATSMLHLAT